MRATQRAFYSFYSTFIEGEEEDSDKIIRIKRATPLFSEDVVLDQRTGMIGTASAADDNLSISDAERLAHVPLQLSQAVDELERECDICGKNKHEARFCLICQCSLNTPYFHQACERSRERYMPVSEIPSNCFDQEVSPARCYLDVIMTSLFFLVCLFVYHLITHYNSDNPITAVAVLITVIYISIM